ncbi:DUF2690 domain-containing protein [Micromonospora sp. NPDC093277]|uniref:DUF2690 domain-containing protein n=1 Tax=Micromonospora sp. NPDC093277 TaxID=3364291 RepID=UPI0038290975
MLRSRRWLTATAAAISTILLSVGATPAPAVAGSTGDQPAGSLGSFSQSQEAAIAKERLGRGEPALPYITRKLADGSVEKFVDPAAEKKMIPLAGSACGSACDGKDPASFLAPLPGGPSEYAYCSTDAYTKYSRTSSDGRITAELRYSPTCRTAWTRGCCYTAYAGFGYYANGNLRLVVYNYDGRFSGEKLWTAMLDDAGYTYKACYDAQTGGASIWTCTSLW